MQKMYIDDNGIFDFGCNYAPTIKALLEYCERKSGHRREKVLLEALNDYATRLDFRHEENEEGECCSVSVAEEEKTKAKNELFGQFVKITAPKE